MKEFEHQESRVAVYGTVCVCVCVALCMHLCGGVCGFDGKAWITHCPPLGAA